MEVHSLYDEISDREQAHADEPLNLMASTVMNMTEKLRIEKEIAAAGVAFASTPQQPDQRQRFQVGRDDCGAKATTTRSWR